jgi:hypothetical protein
MKRILITLAATLLVAVALLGGARRRWGLFINFLVCGIVVVFLVISRFQQRKLLLD